MIDLLEFLIVEINGFSIIQQCHNNTKDSSIHPYHNDLIFQSDLIGHFRNIQINGCFFC